jgi:general transcription factor 3C polypeptide 2
MHRVRWSMNIGSERWLWSGGAAGIVRCQEIKMSGVDICLARKR